MSNVQESIKLKLFRILGKQKLEEGEKYPETPVTTYCATDLFIAFLGSYRSQKETKETRG